MSHKIHLEEPRHVVENIAEPTAALRPEAASAAPPELTEDILSRIREHLHAPPVQNGDPEQVFQRMIHPSLDLPSSLPLRAASTFYNRVAREVLPVSVYWENLKATAPPGIVDIAAEMRKIETSYVEDPHNPAEKHVRLFRRLMQVFKNHGVRIETGDPLKIRLEDYRELQQKVKDAELERCWPTLRQSMLASLPRLGCVYSLFIPSVSANADQIRGYFAKASNYPLSFVIRIDLSNLGLHEIPKELVYFRNLERLDLRNNHLTDARLERLSRHGIVVPLSENRPFQRLIELDLGNDRIEEGNKLTHLPNFSLFPSLERVRLGNISTIQSFAIFNVTEPLLHRAVSLSFHFNGSPVSRYAGDEYFSSGEVNYQTLTFLKNYKPRSPLARLYHAVVYTDTNETGLKALVSRLSTEDTKALFYYIWVNSGSPQIPPAPGTLVSFKSYEWIQRERIVWGRENCFVNMDVFKRSIHSAIKHKLPVVSPDLEEIQNRLWRISGRPIREDGSHRTIRSYSDLKRLADALDPSIGI